MDGDDKKHKLEVLKGGLSKEEPARDESWVTDFSVNLNAPTGPIEITFHFSDNSTPETYVFQTKRQMLEVLSIIFHQH